MFLAPIVGPAMPSGLTPVIVVPGTGGSQLEARLNKPTTRHFWCARSTKDFYRLWLDTSELLVDQATQCWADNVRLQWNATSKQMTNAIGVETRTPDFGGVSAFEQLDPAIPLWGSAYFHALIEALVSVGYERGTTIRGAPYDFRYAPSSLVGREFQLAFKTLGEQTALSNGGRRVVLVAHSMGCLQTLRLLQSQNAEWKKQYVQAFVPISGPWAGTAHELLLFASGSSEGVATVHPLTIRDEQRSYETNHWMLPHPDVFGNATLLSTAARGYTARDYAAFFADIGWAPGPTVYGQVATLLSLSTPPGVPTHCWWSSGRPTEASFVYGPGAFPDAQPTVTKGDGDGTVNLPSLEVCGRWAGVHTRVFPGQSHMDIVKDTEVIGALMAILGQNTSLVAGDDRTG